MTLKDVIRKGFDKIGDGNFKTASIIDKEGETITVIPIDQLNTIDKRYAGIRKGRFGRYDAYPFKYEI